MDKTIVTALLVMASVISAVLVFNAIYPAMQQTGDAMGSMEARANERLKSQVQFIHAAPSGNNIQIWVKNVGALRVAAVDASDLFFGLQGSFSRIPFETGTPHWEYAIENDTEWNPSATLRITIVGSQPWAAGTYFARLVIPNGVSADYLTSW